MARRISHPPSDAQPGWVVLSPTAGLEGRTRGVVVVYANLVGKPKLLEDSDPMGTAEVVERLQAGLPKAALAKVRALMGITAERLSWLIDVAPRTIARRARLAADESERLFRVARLFHRAIEVLGDRGAAQRWFESPKPALGGRMPMELVRSELGAGEVENLLGQIEHGVYS